MRKALFEQLLNEKHTSVWVDNYEAPRSIRLIFEFDEDEYWPACLAKAYDEQDSGIVGEDPHTYIRYSSGDQVLIDVGKKLEKAFNLGWTGMSE